MATIVNTGVPVCELGVILITLPLSAFHFYLLATTSLLHINLKWLLLLQFFAVTLVAAGLLPELIIQFWFPHWTASVTEMSKIFSFNARSMAGDFMILERILATFYVRSYEQFKRPHFGVFAIVITIVLSLIITYEDQIKGDKTKIAQLTALAAYIFTILSLVSVVILAMLLWYNQKTYRRNIIHSHSHSLTKRYQLSENIRTSRQLIPVIFLHFLSNLIGTAGTLTLFYSYRSLGTWYAIAGHLLVLIVISFNLIIQVAVIRCHPILRRRARQICRHFCLNSIILAVCSKSKSPKPCSNSRGSGPLLSINGTQLINSWGNESESHFKMLSDLWK